MPSDFVKKMAIITYNTAKIKGELHKDPNNPATEDIARLFPPKAEGANSSLSY
jgi:hypothetical protein